jgi:hypothetical protein
LTFIKKYANADGYGERNNRGSIVHEERRINHEKQSIKAFKREVGSGTLI